MMQKRFRYDPHAAAETADFLSKFLKSHPQVAIITGTGLGEIASSLQIEHAIEYQSIPDFPVSTVVSHPGRMLFGSLAGQSAVVMQGRLHLYEGYSPLAVTFPIRVFQALKIKMLVLINASGGLNSAFTAGDIMIIDDHINLTGENPLVGGNEDSWGARFPDMTSAYSMQLREMAHQASQHLRIQTQRGVYAGLKGPSLETPAEIRFLQTIGADAVGFSTVMETIAAVHAGIKVLGLATITNVYTPQQSVPADVDKIISIAESTAPQISDIITGVIEQF
jgi:purine-nucleoside phosphorylase